MCTTSAPLCHRPVAFARRVWLAVLLTGTGWSAEPVLWQRAVEGVVKSPPYWAEAVASRMVVYDGDRRELGAVVTLRRLQVEDGQPVWNETQRSRRGDPGMVITMDLGFQKEARTILDGYVDWTHLKSGEVDGAAVEVWQARHATESGNQVIASFEVGTARPRRLQFTVPYRSLLGTLEISVDVSYAAGPDGVWLPFRAVVDQSGRYLFRKRSIHIENEYQDWRPAGSAAAPRPKQS